MKHFPTYPSVLMILLLVLSCGKDITDQSGELNSGTAELIQLSFPIPANLQEFVSSAVAVVSAADMDTIEAELSVSETMVEGVIRNVPAGEDRHFEVFVYDENRNLTYYGNTISDVEAGSTITLNIVLYPQSGGGTVIIIGTFFQEPVLVFPEVSTTYNNFPELNVFGETPVGSTIQAMYSKTTSENRQFRRGIVEFKMPEFSGELSHAELKLFSGTISREPVVEVYFYEADLMTTLDDYHRTDNLIAAVDSIDENLVIDITRLAKEFEGKNLGFCLKLSVDPDFDDIAELVVGFVGAGDERSRIELNF